MIDYKGMRVRIFLDFTAEMASRRAQFYDVGAKLRECGIIHPATVILTFNEEKK